MKNSDEKILVTHAGSLPRNETLTDLLIREFEGEKIDANVLQSAKTEAVQKVVRDQIAVGIDVINDGDLPRPSFSSYVTQRMKGFGSEGRRLTARDFDDFPDFVRLMQSRVVRRVSLEVAPKATGEIVYEKLMDATSECEALKSGANKLSSPPSDIFMAAASPGIVSTTMLNAHYDTQERYVLAIARQMKKEYELIASYGFLVQIDAPDLGIERSKFYKEKSDREFIAAMEIHIAALNEALSNIPRNQVRLHCCWGNWEGPHTHDVPLETILPLLYQANVGALSIEFANPRHQHEYAAVKANPLPSHMLLIPGVIDTTTNFVEHPQLVANRICEAVASVGDRSRVIAGTDCGFSAAAGLQRVAGDVAWAKLKACREGADIASRRLWGK
jgi:5-methyltetrahydropteroyltriglutamate--homocysteine methyltransferase